MFLYCDDLTGFLCSFDDKFFIQGLNCVDIDDPGLNTFLGESFSGFKCSRDAQSGSDDGDIPAVP